MGAGYASLQSLAVDRARLPEVRRQPGARHRPQQHQAQPAGVAAPAGRQDPRARHRRGRRAARRSCETLLALGIELGQGFHFHREDPMLRANGTDRMRNAEVIRQWKILKRIEAGRYTTAAGPRRRARRHRAHHPARHRGAAGGGLPALRRARRRPQDLAAGRGLQAAADPDLHAGRAGRALLRQEPDVVPGRRAVRAGPGVRLREDPGGAARAQPALPGAHPGPVRGAARALEGLLEQAGRDRVR